MVSGRSGYIISKLTSLFDLPVQTRYAGPEQDPGKFSNIHSLSTVLYSRVRL